MNIKSLSLFFVFVGSVLGTYVPYVPGGGVGTTNASGPPQYVVLSDFDWQSINLALNQEYIELDLFLYGLQRFNSSDFDDARLTPADVSLLNFMAAQESGHAAALKKLLTDPTTGISYASKPCTYIYPEFPDVHSYVVFSQLLTRWGESGVYGFLQHLDSRPAAQILLESITTEARQQMVFRQWQGLGAMSEWFETGITQSMAWTLLARYIQSCPSDNPRIAWQNFPALNITNNPTVQSIPSIAFNSSTSISTPGQQVNLTWEAPGKVGGYNNSFATSTNAGAGRFVAWFSQLNVTYTDLTIISDGTGSTVQPDLSFSGMPYNGTEFSTQVVNGSVFIVITDDNPYLTPFNTSLINDHIVAGPAIFQAG